jgi:hypothetical protein
MEKNYGIYTYNRRKGSGFYFGSNRWKNVFVERFQ